jgi:DNA-binding MarR family transcriptional regulator
MARRGRTTPDLDVAWRPHPGRETSILFDVFVLGQRTKALVGTAMRGAALRPDEYAVYSVVFEAGSITSTELARRLGMPLTTVADYVRSMVSRGHVRKDRYPRDHRAHPLSLTPQGLRAHRRASAAFDQAYRSLIAELALDEKRARSTIRALSDGADRALRGLRDQEAGRAG